MHSPHEEALFTIALAKPASERAAFLDRECGDDKTLRQRLGSLLAAHAAKDSFLEPDAPQPNREPLKTIKLEMPADEPPDEAVGQTIGRYKLLERVGEGGCGVVYVAEQTEPVRRRVALKVIKLGMDTKQVVARFEAERQALALMDHPNIAKVLDAGATDTGRPLLRDGTGAGHPDHRLLRPEQARHQGTARSVHPGLPGHPARAPEGDHPPRHQAVEHPGHAARRRAGAQGD